MSIAEINWQNFLSPDSDLPPDVAFLVKGEEEGGDGQSRTIRAHRLFLSGVSPVFKGMFFGPMKDTAEVVEVKETTPEAFDTMINYIYNPPNGDTFNLDHISCPQKLFELVTLANKYQILNLVTMASEALGNLALTRENMIFTATVAKNYKGVFDDLSTKVLLKCLKFLLDTTRGAGDIYALIKETVDNFPGANLDVLRELIGVGNVTLQLEGIWDKSRIFSGNFYLLHIWHQIVFFAGWGNLVYFDTEEHQIPEGNGKIILAEFQKLGTQWKIIHEFKPTEYPQGTEPTCKKPPVSLVIGLKELSGRGYVGIAFPFPKIDLVYRIHKDDKQRKTLMFLRSDQLPKLGEWTKIEISHEEENGRFFLSLTVGGMVVGREDVTDTELRNPTEVKICFGQIFWPSQPGFIRKMVVLEK